MTSLVRSGATYEDLLRLSLEPVAEIVGGDLYTSPKPSIASAVAAFALSGALGGAEWWILFQPELQLADDILVADLAGWRRERLARPPATVAIDLTPDWVCEILSPHTEAFDRTRKLPVYARHAVSYAWLVDPGARSLEVFQGENGRWALRSSFVGDALVEADPFHATRLDLPTLWGDRHRPR
jgi:Uma2 family endonuclease